MSVIALAVLLGVTIFFSAVIYMNTYHKVSISHAMTVSETSDGQAVASARTFMRDSYPYESWKTTIKEFDDLSYNSSDASAVIQWAVDHSNNVTIEAGTYNLTYGIELRYRNTSINIDKNVTFIYPVGWFFDHTFVVFVTHDLPEFTEP
jgi:hypothetical protein